MGTYSRLPERLYYLYFILNELVLFYNHEVSTKSQKGMAEFFDKQPTHVKLKHKVEKKKKNVTDWLNDI